MKKIIYIDSLDRLCVVHPVINDNERGILTEEESFNRAYVKLPSDARNILILENETFIPSDRYFRNAWQIEGNGIGVNMDKAREIHRNVLREIRKPLLEQADIEFMQTLERGLPTTNVVARKQALRDITQDVRIDNATTPDELKALTLEVLLNGKF